MPIRNFSVTVAIAVAWFIHMAPVVLSAPVTPISQASQDDNKHARAEQCQSGGTRSGHDRAGAFSKGQAVAGDACGQKKLVVASRGLQPYTAIMASEEADTPALLGFPCSRSMECNVAALEPLRHDGKYPWPTLAPGFTAIDTDRLNTAFTSMRSTSIAGGEDGTKLILARDAFMHIDSPLSGWAAGDETRTFFWDRCLNFGPLLLLFLEKLLGRL
jgi:hypothetical protein